MNVSKLTLALFAAGTCAIGSAYAATVNSPGPIAFGGNVDSKITSYGGGGNMFLNSGTMAMSGSVDSSGITFFDQLDLAFDSNEDANGYRTQLQATSDGSGTYCPNADSATISFSARIRVTKVAGVSISTTPCFITINGGSAFTLTTGNSGSLSGAVFSASTPKLVAEVPLGALVTGTCSSGQKTAISSYYGLASGPNASIEIFHATVNPSNLTGNGC